MQNIEIIFEDKDILVCYKPAGLAVQSRNVTMPDLENMLRSQLNRRGEKGGLIHVIHRLDQPVEGLLVFAKNKKAAADLSSQVMSKGEMSKNYLAVVYGTFPDEKKEGTLTDLIGRDQKTGNAIIIEDKESDKSAKEAKLSYKVIGECDVPKGKIAEFHAKDEVSNENAGKRKLSLINISLDTGRFHQIRAQFSNIGYPIMGDRRYFLEESNALSRELMVKNIALCAYRLSFRHPVSGEIKEFEIKPKGEIYKYFE